MKKVLLERKRRRDVKFLWGHPSGCITDELYSVDEFRKQERWDTEGFVPLFWSMTVFKKSKKRRQAK